MTNGTRFPFKLALNTSTLLPFNLDVKEQIRVAAEAGYEGIELWVRDIEAYLNNGGTVAELKQYISDSGITVVNAIAFFKWSDADEATRRQGLEQAESEMRMLAELGCIAVAAPPFGNVEGVSLDEMARNFAKLTDIAREIGIVPYLEFWGRAKKLSRLSEVLYVAAESGLSDVKMLLDPFHMYTGGSHLEGLELVNGNSIGIVHVNDYPENPPRETIADKDRVFPGDGAMPSEKFAQLLDSAGYNGYLSLELFIQDYGNKSALEVASEGIEKVKKAYSI
jgi:2-keto-myo-inositol isomerase